MTEETDARYRAYIAAVDGGLEPALRQGLDFVKWETHVRKDTRVFVKPNFTFPYHSAGITTNPEVLRALLTLLKSRADTVIVGESDGGNRSYKAEDAFTGHGMYEICRQTGAELVNLSTLPSRVVESRVAGKKVRVELPQLLLEDIDCFISVPVLKVHVITTVSLSLKNSWGCIPDDMRGLHHQNLSHKLALIAKLLKPKMVVIDGTYALNKHGPMFGEPVKMDLVLLADNTLLADSLGASVLGFAPRRLHHLMIAERAGLGTVDLSAADFNQDWRAYATRFEVNKTLVDRLASLLFYSDALARLVMDSPLTPVIYRVARLLRNSEEQHVASEMPGHQKLGPY